MKKGTDGGKINNMDSFMKLFSQVKENCKAGISPTAFDLWLKPIEPVKLEGDTAYLFIKSEFQKNIIIDKYLDALTESFSEVLGFPVNVEIISDETLNANNKATPEELENEMKNNTMKSEILEKTYIESEYDHTFGTFIVGSSNTFAYSACRAISRNNNKGEYNPLFIYGQSGLGKTHLLMAIKNEMASKFPELNMIYITGEQFTNELILTIEHQMMNTFREKYRQADVLLVDDIQFIGGKDRTQEEFFHTFNVLHQTGKQIVLASDRPPKEIKSLDSRLRTRFEWGLIADVVTPDFETRVAILRRKAQLLDIEISDEVIEFISNKLKSDIRQLEGAVKKIKAYKLLTSSLPSISMAQTVVRDILNDQQPIQVTVEKIINEVSGTYRISVSDIRSRNRSAPVSLARQTAIYVIKEITNFTLEQIGKEFGGRDHATIVYGLQKVEKMMAENSHYREVIDDIIKNFKNPV